MMVKMLGVSEDGDDGYEVNGQPSQEQSYMHQFLLFFLLILNVQISSRPPSFEIQSIQALRQVLGQKHHTPDGIESSLGFFCKRVTPRLKENLSFLFLTRPKTSFLG